MFWLNELMDSHDAPYPKDILDKYWVYSRRKTGDIAEIATLCCRRSGKFYTLKKIPDGTTVQERVETRLRQIVHPHLIHIHEQSITGNMVYLVVERLEGGDLFNRIKSFGPISEALTKFYFYQMVLAMDHLSEKVGVLHTNLKAQNVMLSVYNDDYCIVKLTDYYHRHGDVDRIEEKRWMTLAYKPPRVQQATDIIVLSRSDDIWSLGVILFQCLTGWLPVKGGCTAIEAFQNNTRVPKHLKPLLKMLFDEYFMEAKPCGDRTTFANFVAARMRYRDLLTQEWFQDGELNRRMDQQIRRHKLPDVRPDIKGTLAGGPGGDAQCLNEKLR